MRPAHLATSTLAGLALIAGLTACGSDAKKPSVDSSGTSSAATAGAASTSAQAAASVPTAADLLPSVKNLISPSITPANKAAAVVGGTDLVATFTQLDAVIKRVGSGNITFVVKNVKPAATQAQASVQIFNKGKAFPNLYPAFWQYRNGTWQLTRAGACSVIPASGVNCPGGTVK